MAWDAELVGVALNIAATDETPLRVMAGPGTGKSFAMKRRVARHLEEGTPPGRILAVTFTRNAAAALVDDLNALGVFGCENIRCGTLHSFCFRLLAMADVFDILERVPRPLITFNRNGVSQYEALPLLYDLIQMGDFGGKRNCTKRIRAFEAAWARLQSDEPGWPGDPTDNEFHTRLLAWLQFHRALLIGELVPESLRYLRNNPASPILIAYDEVIVDEYQDLNKAEQVLLDLLSENGRLSVVGDEDQSIYSFRHAHPVGIVEFADTHEGTHDENLIECRRCPLRVVEIADFLIRHNHPPTDEARLNPLDGNPEGEIAVVQWQSLEDEAEGIAQYVSYLIDERGVEPSEILVLSARRLIGYGIRDKLRNSGVPTHSFYHEEALEPDEAQLAFSLLTLLANRDDRVALRWWLGHGSPSWRTGQYRRLREYCEEHGVSPKEALDQIVADDLTLPHTNQLVTRYEELNAALATCAELELADLIEHLLPDGEEGTQALREAALISMTDGMTVPQLLDALRTGVTQPEMPKEGDFVRVMSLHKSKGLTSRVVVVAGCIEGLIPFIKDGATDAEEAEILQEQRRLFYVAITRCRDALALSSAINIDRALAFQIGARVGRRRGPIAPTIASRFLHELGPTAPDAIAGNTWIEEGFPG